MTHANIAVFASGIGSNFVAIMEAIEWGKLDATVSLLVCDKPEAKVMEKAERYNVPVFAFEPKSYPSKQAFEQEIVAQLSEAKVEWIILAGYMRLIGQTLLDAFPSKIINIHPSLLPAFPGLDAIGQALQAGVHETGVTIHYVDAGMDTGKIIAQQALSIEPEEDRNSLQQRMQTIEHFLYPQTIQDLLYDNR